MKMIANRQLFMLLTFLVIGTTAFSQKTMLGVKAGANLAKWNISGVGGIGESTLAGFDAGVLIEIPVSKTFYVQSEASYTQFGSNITSAGDKVVYNLDYATIPVFAKYRLPNGFGVYAGPGFGFLLSAKGKISDSKVDVKEMFKSTDLFAVMGVEYNFPVGLTAAVRYNHGITNIYVADNAGKIHNSSFNIGVAYKFSTSTKAK